MSADPTPTKKALVAGARPALRIQADESGLVNIYDAETGQHVTNVAGVAILITRHRQEAFVIAMDLDPQVLTHWIRPSAVEVSLSFPEHAADEVSSSLVRLLFDQSHCPLPDDELYPIVDPKGYELVKKAGAL